MTRFALPLTLALALTFALVACGGEKPARVADPEPMTAEPVAVAVPQSEALIGNWQTGQHRISFAADKSFNWEMPRPCGAPPCPVKASKGTWEVRNGKLYLTREGGDNTILEFRVDLAAKNLWFRDLAAKKEFTLPAAQ